MPSRFAALLEKPALYRWLALGWALLVLAVVVHQLQFWRAARLDTDVLALLPQDAQQQAVGAATRKLADDNARQLVLLIGTPDWAQTRQAAERMRSSLADQADLLQPQTLDAHALDVAVAFYQPWRDRLLTASQRAWLNQAKPEEIGAMALMRLYQLGGPQLAGWHNDPLGLWPGWWAERAAESNVRPRDGQLWLSGGGREWILLSYVSQHGAFAVSGDAPLSQTLQALRQQLELHHPGVQLLAVGVPLYAEAAAAQASQEMSTIGLGSLAAVLLLVWLTFRSLRPIVLVGLSLLVGCAVALSVTALLFDKVHLLTLVFGASLVGVAEDYGFHYFAARQGQPAGARYRILRSLLPGLVLALLTSVLAYLALGIAPFPGLQQMAVFSAVGLAAAFLTVLCWFPCLDHGELAMTGFARRMAGSLQRWPYWRLRGKGGLLMLLVLGLLAGGLYQLRSQDDIRQLYSAPPALLADQRELNQLLGLPSPAQFFLVAGRNAEEVLQREAHLKQRLDPLVKRGDLLGYRAVSDWLPSQASQADNAHLSAAAEQTALQAASQVSGETLTRPAFAQQALLPEAWLASPAATAIRAQWLGQIGELHYSVLMLRGLKPVQLEGLAQLAHGLDGVQWVDRTADISQLLGRYRLVMAGLLLAGYLAVALVMFWRFGRQAWRAMLPTVLGSLCVLAIFGWVGEPLQLFSVLALLLLLGMGVDYGIFLLEHPGDGTAWLAVALAGVSTLLSFGLLALSATPALRAFGLTMLLGEVAIWLITPCFRPEPAVPGAHTLNESL